MKVTVISATENPVDVIGIAAGTCYGKPDVSEKRVRHCFNNGHMSVFEHASITFKVEGISRACMAQLTRHRLVSFCVESQRYNKYDLSGDEWYVKPNGLDMAETMRVCADRYMDALANGIKPEDARYLLPEATKTNLVMTMNVRNLFHIFDMRLDKAAQWEIRDVVIAMLSAASEVNDQWYALIGLYVGGAK